MESKQVKLLLKGLGCANCANKIEDKTGKLSMVKESVVNFSTSTLILSLEDGADEEKVIEEVKAIVKALEPDVIVSKYNNKSVKKQKNTCNSNCCQGEHHHGHSHEHGHSHDHGHSHGEEGEESSIKDKVVLAIGVVLYLVALFTGKENIYTSVLYIASYVLIGGEVVYSAFRNILRREVFDENFLMTVATVGAFFIGEYPEAVAVMLFYQIGEMFQDYAVDKSRKSITSLMDIRAEYATLLVNGKEKKVTPEEVELNDVILIKPGERVPVDGIVIEGESSLDTSALTGESVPRSISKDQEILSGTINLSGVIKVKVTKEFSESTVSRILDLVQNAGSKKANTEKFITKFAKVYTPVVVVSALLLAVIPPLVISDALFSDWVYRALIFLVVSCPCALVISVPLALFAGIGAASKEGVLIKGGNYLEALKDADTIVFDKTGTLTKGVFNVVKVQAVDIEEEELIRIAALGESFSNHPIAKSILRAYGKEVDKSKVTNYEELSGNGVKVVIEDKETLLGNEKLMNKYDIKFDKPNDVGTIVHVAIEGKYKGYIVISDEIKEDSLSSIKALKKIGIRNVVMLTGDNKAVAESVAKQLEIDTVYSELLPGDKVNKIEEVLSREDKKGKVLFVGDGINDAPVLARADIGIAMGGIGSDAAIEAADVVLMRDELSAISEGIKIAKKTNRILWQNIIFSLGIKVIVLILSALGMANMWEGVFADVGVTLIAVLNSMRALKK